MNCKEYAKQIRQEIRRLIRNGVLPKGKYSVRTSHNKINITPNLLLLPITEIFNMEYDGTFDSPMLTKKGEEILDILKELANRHQVNSNADDSYADYPNCNYYTCVQYSSFMYYEAYKMRDLPKETKK